MSKKPFGFSDDNENENKDNEQNFFSANFGKNDSSFSKFFSQISNLISNNVASNGKKNGYDLPLWIAKQQLANSSGVISSSLNNATIKSIEIANIWVNEGISFKDYNVEVQSWSSRDWLENTISTWKTIFEPFGKNQQSNIMFDIPEQAQQFASPLMGILNKMGGVSFGIQSGNILGKISKEILTSTDLNIPLSPDNTVALLSNNIEQIAKGLNLPTKEVFLYYSTREIVRKRLFKNSPWIKAKIIDLINEFAAGIDPSKNNINNIMHEIDPNMNMQDMQKIISQQLFEPNLSESQTEIASRIEHLISLIEGWTEVTTKKILENKLDNISDIIDVLRINSSNTSITEDVFQSLFNINISVESTFNAIDMWEKISDLTSIEKRDSVWNHPDFLPSIEDLKKPANFIDSIIGGDTGVFTDPIAQIEEMFKNNSDDNEDNYKKDL